MQDRHFYHQISLIQNSHSIQDKMNQSNKPSFQTNFNNGKIFETGKCMIIMIIMMYVS